MSGDSAAQVQAEELPRGEHEDGRNLKEGLQKLPRRKGKLDGDPEKTTENLMQSRKLIITVDLE